MIKMRKVDPGPFKGEQNTWLSRLLEDIDRTTSSLYTALSDGLIISATLAGSGAQNLIPHTLGRAIQGWIPVGGNFAALGLYEGPSGYDRTLYVDLRTGTAGSQTVNLLVF